MMEWVDIEWVNPIAAWLLLPLALSGCWYFWRERNLKPVLFYSSATPLAGLPQTWAGRLRWLPAALRLLGLALLVVALMRPQSRKSWQNVHTEGIDIMLSFDISASMLARDLKPNRIDASKQVAMDFVESRPDDRIGLVVFSGESFTQCPLTSDHAVLKNLFAEVHTGMVNNGTAIGMGLATAISRLKQSKAKSKVIILLTDGVNNAGNISPELAAEAAKPFGIRIYTIGVGTLGMAYSPVGMYPNGEFVFDYVKVEIDEPVLRSIARETGGKYFRATDRKSLGKIYSEIDKMEKTKFEEHLYTKRSEWFFPIAGAALFLLLLETLIKRLWLKTLA
jgi:Ca-activated chloride channel family protein